MEYHISHFYQFTAESNKLSVIPDACVDILFWKKDGKLLTKLAGTFLEKGESEADINGEYFGVRFLPGFNPVESYLSLSEIVNCEWDFHHLITADKRQQFLEAMFFAQSFDEKIKAFMDYYLTPEHRQIENPNCLKIFLKNEIIRSNGNLKLYDLSQMTGYSERYLNMKVHEDFGMNPKNLIRFIRFQKAISNLTDTIGYTRCIDTALESGYFDQSHFINEFKKFSGSTPTIYLDHLMDNAYNTKLHVVG
jgi:AraC-like DNA-binding protein